MVTDTASAQRESGGRPTDYIQISTLKQFIYTQQAGTISSTEPNQMLLSSLVPNPHPVCILFVVCCFQIVKVVCVGDGFESSLGRIDGIRFYDLHLHYKRCVHMVA